MMDCLVKIGKTYRSQYYLYKKQDLVQALSTNNEYHQDSIGRGPWAQVQQ